MLNSAIQKTQHTNKSDKKIIVRLLPSKKERLTFEKAAEEWLLSRRPQIKESTYIKYRNILKNHISPDMKKMPLMSLNQNYFERYCRELLSAGGKDKKGLSPKTVSDIFSVVRSILRYASQDGKLAGNVCNISIKHKTKEIRILSRAEQERLYKYLISNLNGMNAGILLSLFAGLRIGEICALQWKDISFDERSIHVCKTMQRIQTENDSEHKTKIVITPPKSDYSNRIIPLPKHLSYILNTLPHNQSDFILSGSSLKFTEPRSMQNHFKRVLKKCSINDANYHSLRHTFATRCIEVGFDEKCLSEILGHSGVDITLNRYVHPSFELKQNNMEKLSSLFRTM